MRRTGHIRERSPGAFELRYSLGTDPATGKRKIATATFRGSKKDADKELRRLLYQVDQNQHPKDPDRLTTGQWLQRWLEQTRGEVAPQTHRRYETAVRNHLVPTLGHVLLVRLSPVDVQGLYSCLAQGTLAPRSRRHVALILTNALNRAVEQRLIATSPAQPLRRRLPRVERREMAVLDQSQSQQLLVAARPTALYPAIMLALATGMRRNEALALRWTNVDFDRGSILVAESLEEIGKTIRVKPPKNDKARTVTLPASANEELRCLKRDQAEQLLGLGVRQTGDTLVCTREDGSMLRPSMLSDGFRALIRRTGLPVIRFHDLRHSHATQLLLAGVHPKVAAERLGHADVGLTLNTYSHVLPGMQEDAAARIDAVFQPSVANSVARGGTS
jgi:integrase